MYLTIPKIPNFILRITKAIKFPLLKGQEWRQPDTDFLSTSFKF